MDNMHEIRSQLLSQLSQPENLSEYRSRVAEIIEKNQKRLRVEQVVTTIFWIFCVASATAYLWFGNGDSPLPRAPFLACIFFLWGGVELLKHRIHAAQIEIQKDLKQLQLQVLEIKASGQGPGAGPIGAR
jgi:hypothetical protein